MMNGNGESSASHGSGHSGGAGFAGVSPTAPPLPTDAHSRLSRKRQRKAGRPAIQSQEALLASLSDFINSGNFRQKGSWPSRTDFIRHGKGKLYWRLYHRGYRQAGLAARYGLVLRKGGYHEQLSQIHRRAQETVRVTDDVLAAAS